MASPVLSWGRVHRFDQHARTLSAFDDRDVVGADGASAPLLAHGLGRSYGDVGLNDGGHLLLTPLRDLLISADWQTGRIRAQSGLSLKALIDLCLPRGWMVPVAPGTQYVTLGGAVANDVHGKNHHRLGSFGAHVLALELWRSDGEVLVLNRDENRDLFALTLGGLGLTGFVATVELQLIPVESAWMDCETLACENLDHFFELSAASDNWSYTVAWVDCFAPARSMGRGLFSRANFAASGSLDLPARRTKTWPVETPGFLLNKASISAFNLAYRHRPGANKKGRVTFDRVLFPLDGLLHWNRLYGRHGFYQHQCLLPPETARDGLTALLRTIERSGEGSFLAVLKQHGAELSPGVMSFCGPGVSLALDFANRGARTLGLLDVLDTIVRRSGGRLYPAKDGRMSAALFQATYPRWRDLERARDPAFSSSFWRRVTGLT